MLVGGVPAEEYGQERDERGQRPHVEQRVEYGALRHCDRVLKRADYRVVPVHADATQVQYRRGAEVHVQAVPHITHHVPEHPLAGDLDAGIERHRAQCNQEIGERQRHHVVVGEYTELAMPHHADHHQCVAQYRAKDNRAHGHRLDDQHRSHRAGHRRSRRAGRRTAAGAAVCHATHGRRRRSRRRRHLASGRRPSRLVALADHGAPNARYHAAARAVTRGRRLLAAARPQVRVVRPPNLQVHGGRPPTGGRSHFPGWRSSRLRLLSLLPVPAALPPEPAAPVADTRQPVSGAHLKRTTQN